MSFHALQHPCSAVQSEDNQSPAPDPEKWLKTAYLKKLSARSVTKLVGAHEKADCPRVCRIWCIYTLTLKTFPVIAANSSGSDLSRADGSPLYPSFTQRGCSFWPSRRTTSRSYLWPAVTRRVWVCCQMSNTSNLLFSMNSFLMARELKKDRCFWTRGNMIPCEWVEHDSSSFWGYLYCFLLIISAKLNQICIRDSFIRALFFTGEPEHGGFSAAAPL